MSAVQPRPRTVSDILHDAFTIYRRHFVTLFATVLVVYLPLVAFLALMTVLADGRGAYWLAGASSIGVLEILVITYMVLATILLWGALTRQVSNAFTSETVSLADGYGHALERFLPLLAAAIVTLVPIFLGLILFIAPGLLIGVIFFAVGQVVIIEDEGPLSALGRSRELARGAWARILGVIILANAPSIVFSPVAEELQALSDTAWLAFATGSIIEWLIFPFTAAAYVLLYYDRRTFAVTEAGVRGREPAS